MNVVFKEKLSSKAFLPEAVCDGPRIDRAEVALIRGILSIRLSMCMIFFGWIPTYACVLSVGVTVSFADTTSAVFVFHSKEEFHKVLWR
jgi:hypothetical protein